MIICEELRAPLVSMNMIERLYNAQLHMLGIQMCPRSFITQIIY